MSTIDKGISAVWYDSHNPGHRKLAVRLHKGRLTVMHREKPTDVWSPPQPMMLTGWHNKSEAK